uniref:SLED domain-containing protein n=1 Tax=Parastrongyloides trichosuri TaxID=131310 RepID=A0A0N4ZT66_PARTI
MDRQNLEDSNDSHLSVSTLKNDLYMMKIQDKSLKYTRQFPVNNDRIFYKDLDFLNRPIGEVSIPYYTDKVAASLTGRLKDAFPAVLLSVTRNTVQVLNFKNHKVELVPYDNVWLRRTSSDQKIFLNHEETDPTNEHSYSESYFINENGVKLERLSTAKCMVKVQNFIREEDFFLYQDLDGLFSVVQITTKYGPFVIVKMIDDSEKLLPIRSGRNYSLELLSQLSLAGLIKKGGYKPGKETFFNKVPKCAFLRSKHNSHEFRLGNEVEVICPDTRENIYMGYVSEVFSEELFRVTIIKYAENEKNKTLLCDNANEYILPKRFCSRHNLKLTSPFESHSGNDLKTFKKRHGIIDAADRKTFAQIQCYDKIEEFTRVEYYDEKGEVMVPAVIVRSAENVIFIILEDRDMMKPLAFNCASAYIFPVGTAEKYNITLVKPLDRDYEDTRRVRMDVEKNFKGFYQDLNINLPLDCGTKNETIDKENITFSSVFKDISKIAPKFYLNYDCNPGPFLKAESIKSKPVINNGGPLASIVYYINRLLIQCSYGSGRVRTSNILSCTEKESNIIMKKPVNSFQEDDTIQYNSKGQTFSCEAPSSSEDFPLYLRKILFKLQACPNLISLTKLEESCPCDCKNVDPWFKLYVNNFVNLTPAEYLAGPATATRGKKSAKRNNAKNDKKNNCEEIDTKKLKLCDKDVSTIKIEKADQRSSLQGSREASESKMIPPKFNAGTKKRATTVDIVSTKLRRSGRVAGKNSETGSPSKTADTTPEPPSSPSVSPSDDNSQESVGNNSRLSTPMQADLRDKKLQEMSPQEFAALVIAETSFDIREKVENIDINELLRLTIPQIQKRFDIKMGVAMKINRIIQTRK